MWIQILILGFKGLMLIVIGFPKTYALGSDLSGE